MAVTSNLTIPTEGHPVDNDFFQDMVDTINYTYDKADDALSYGTIARNTAGLWEIDDFRYLGESLAWDGTKEILNYNRNDIFADYTALAWVIRYHTGTATINEIVSFTTKQFAGRDGSYVLYVPATIPTSTTTMVMGAFQITANASGYLTAKNKSFKQWTIGSSSATDVSSNVHLMKVYGIKPANEP